MLFESIARVPSLQFQFDHRLEGSSDLESGHMLLPLCHSGIDASLSQIEYSSVVSHSESKLLEAHKILLPVFGAIDLFCEEVCCR